MRRLLTVLFTVLLILLAGNALRGALASDATRIRWLLEGMAAGFDDGSPNRAVRGLARDWRDQESGVEREWLRQGLIAFFHEERTGPSRELRYRVELPRESLAIEVEGDEARLEVQARFLERETDELAWEVAIEAALERRDEGWRIVRTEHETLAGRRLGF